MKLFRVAALTFAAVWIAASPVFAGEPVIIAPIMTLTGHNSGVMSASFSPDGSRIVTASADSTARVWDAKTGAALATLSGHNWGVESASFSPDGSRIVTASIDKTARVWDAKTGAALATLSGHSRQVSSASFSPDGSRIVTASNDQTARVWEVKTGAALATLSGHGGEVSGATFSPDGSRIVTGSWDNTARVWDAKTGAALAALSGHGKWVYTPSFSPDGSRIVTASYDERARVWDATDFAGQAARHKDLVSRRDTALAAFDCDAAKAIDAQIGGDTATACAFDKLLKTGAARDLYLAAVKAERDKERPKAKQFYSAILDRFPQDDLALKAGERLTALGDVEAVEQSNEATKKAAAEAQKAASEAAARAEAQTRAAQQSSASSVPGGRPAGTRVFLCVGKNDCCEAIIVQPGDTKSKVEFPKSCFPGGILNPVFYREGQQEWVDNGYFRNQPMR